MRSVFFSAVLLAVASLGYVVVSPQLDVSRSTKPATFSERFAAAMPSGIAHYRGGAVIDPSIAAGIAES